MGSGKGLILAWSFWDFKGHTLLCYNAMHKERVGHILLLSMELDGTNGTIGCIQMESSGFRLSEAMHLFAKGRLSAKHTECADCCESNVSETKSKIKFLLRRFP
jgi:hypothetical protein